MHLTRFCTHLLCAALLIARVFTQEVIELGPCDPSTQGEFRIDATYTGEIGTFDIATTALGLDRNAAETYHLTTLGKELSEDGGVVVKGCFEKNSLYRYVVFYNETNVFSFGEYQLFVNGIKIVDADTFINAEKFTEFYFYGDERVCPSDDARFTLTIQFDSFPEDISWELKNLLDDVTPVILRSNQTTIPPPPGITDYPGYGTEFTEDALYVDRCILRDGRYCFTIADSFGDGIASSGYYEIASNGSIVVNDGGGFGSSESTNFTSNGDIITPTPAPTVSFAPTNIPTSFRPTPPLTPPPTSNVPAPPPTHDPTPLPTPVVPNSPNSLGPRRTPRPTPGCTGAFVLSKPAR